MISNPNSIGGSPYLSVVATSRNDDHGGNMLERMQIFVKSFIEQAVRHDLSCELILVEWNPPADRPRFKDALSWPEESGPCRVRIIEVPARIHNRLRHAEDLPLFQMIAKNVGVRRAEGRFVLCTNIDILFSDELMRLFKEESLSEDSMYRMDRYDADENVPLDCDLDERLDYCRTHLLRVALRKGTLDLRSGALDRIYWPKWILFGRALVGSVVLFPPVWLPLALFLGPLVARLAPETSGILGYFALHRLRVLEVFRRFWAMDRARGGSVLVTAWKLLWGGFVLRGLVRNLILGYGRRLRDLWRGALFAARVPQLHTNACGDFSLLARVKWFDLHGYAEYETYSFHIDSLFCHAAAKSGLKERIIGDPARIYHIEHGAGSGYTPESQKKLWSRLKKSHIRRITNEEYRDLIEAVHTGRHPVRFAGADWGLAGEELVETSPIPAKV